MTPMLHVHEDPHNEEIVELGGAPCSLMCHPWQETGYCLLPRHALAIS